jgi:hypothetical protein
MSNNTDTNDLCFICRDDDYDLAIFAKRLAWDSQFFGYEIARIAGIFPLSTYRPRHDYSTAMNHLLNQAQLQGIKYLFASVFPEDLATIRILSEKGFQLIETRASYHRSLRDYEWAKRFPVRLANAGDVAILSQTARTISNSYDRFHADPFVTPANADRLMEKWIEASINEGFADATLVPDVAEPKAFCTVKYHQDKWGIWGLNLSQPVFSAVSPEFQGWYLKIISELNYHLKDIGAEYAYLTTQITNRAVIRVWETLGFSYGRGEHIFRIIL